MLTLSNISIQFNGTYLFDNVSFAIRPNDKIGLIGRNGAGKSTLLKIITGELSPENGAVHLSNSYKIGYLPQEFTTHSKRTVFDEAATALIEIQNLEKKRQEITEEINRRTDYNSDDYLKLVGFLSDTEERYRIIGGHTSDADIEQILTGLGFLREEFDKPVSEFSGGWQMRVELAKILLTRPDCILLDEPTNHLDIDSIRWLEQFLKNYNGAVVLVSHDRTFLDFITNRTIEISLGNVYDLELPYSKFIETRKLQKEQQLAAYKNQQKQIAETEKYIERFRYKATLASRVQSRVKALEKIERIELTEEDVKQLNIKFPEPERMPRLLVETKSLVKCYGDKLVLNKIDIAVERGEKIAFVGKNGEGKTTLAKIFAKLEDLTDGTIHYANNIAISYFAQHQADMLDEELTVLETIDKVATGEIRTKIRTLLGAFLFSGDAVDKKVKVLSGGEKSRLAICKMLLQPANLLILDEPTNHLDVLAKDVLKNALQDFTGSIIIVSHDRDFLQNLTNKTFEFKNKKVKEFIGDINYYLEKNELQFLMELEENEKKTNVTQSNQKTKSQIDRENQKERQREENRIKKSIESIENEIDRIEQEVAQFEELFLDADFFSDVEQAKIKQEEYNKLKTTLTQKMQEWETLSEKLMSLESN